MLGEYTHEWYITKCMGVGLVSLWWPDHWDDRHKEKESLFFPCRPLSRCIPGYLNSTLHGECSELRHHKIHTFEAGLFEFEDLLFDYRLESQVGGEEPRSERSWGQIAYCCDGTDRVIEQILRKEGRQVGQREEKEKKSLCSVSHF